MLQIKTIRETDPADFDIEVNQALRNGWNLNRRCIVPEGFVAEMEQNSITEAERCCENCRYFGLHGDLEPCVSCLDDGSKWEAQA